MKNVLIVTLLTFVSCTSMRMTYDAQIKNKKDNLNQTFHYEESQHLGYLCPITGIFYGGTCWLYMSYPDNGHIEKTRTNATTKLDLLLGLNNWELVSPPIIKKEDWSSGSESFLLSNNLQFIMTEPQSTNLTYSENDFSISFDFSPLNVSKSIKESVVNAQFATDYDLRFEIKNNSKFLMKINWDESLFIDFDGVSQAVIHEGIKFSNKELSQTPSIIAPNTTSSHIIIPKNNIQYSSNDWRFKSYDFDKNMGKKFRIVISIESNGVKKLISFHFKVAK